MKVEVTRPGRVVRAEARYASNGSDAALITVLAGPATQWYTCVRASALAVR